MAELMKIRTHPDREHATGTDPFDDAPGAPDQGVIVSSGLYHVRVPVDGATVAEVRRRLGDRLDVDPTALPVLDGEVVPDERVRVRAGQLLAFVRHAGEKGAR